MAKDRNVMLLNRSAQAHRDWLALRGESVGKRGTDGAIEKLGMTDRLKAVKILPVSLELIDTHRAVQELVGLLDGSDDGWHQIDRAIYCQYWEVRLYESDLSRAGSIPGFGTVRELTTLDPRLAAHVLSYSVAVNAGPWQRQMMESLEFLVGAIAKRAEDDWRRRVYEPFVMQLVHRLDGRKLPAEVESRDLGPYADIFRCWNDPAAIAGAISRACDYHCQNMIDKGLDEEFDIAPFDLYPVEILAIYRIRERLGLETPKIEHPLLSTPMGSLEPREIAPIDDPIIRRVEELYHSVFGQ